MFWTRRAWYSAKAKQNLCDNSCFIFWNLEWHWCIMHLCLICSFIAEWKLITMCFNHVIPYISLVLENKEIDWDVLILVWLVFVCINFCIELWTSLHHFFWQGNFCQHFYVANCCVVKPPEWEGHSCAADQSLRPSTVRVLIFFLHPLLIANKLTNHHVLLIVNKLPFVIAGTLYRINHFTLLQGSSLPTLLWDERSMQLIARSY